MPASVALELSVAKQVRTELRKHLGETHFLSVAMDFAISREEKLSDALNGSSPTESAVSAPTAGRFDIYSDGGCSPNPGPGAYAYVALEDGQVIDEKGVFHDRYTTNQVMEILGAAAGLNSRPAGSTIMVRSDSQYVVKTMTGEFKRKANHEHWKTLDAAVARHRTVSWEHVRAHKGDVMNERADRLVNQARRLAGF